MTVKNGLPKGVHKVTIRGKVYYYAWRGGPRIKPDDARIAHIQSVQRASLGARRPEAAANEAIAGHLTHRLGSIRQRARGRGVACTLTAQDLIAMLECQAYRCAVSGLSFSLGFKGDRDVVSRRPYRPSVDRVDARKGYTPDNVRVVCCAVNLALNEWGDAVFLQIAKGVVAMH